MFSIPFYSFYFKNVIELSYFSEVSDGFLSHGLRIADVGTDCPLKRLIDSLVKKKTVK